MKVSNTRERLNQLMSTRNLRQVDILGLTERLCNEYNVKFNKSDISQYVSGKTEPNQDKLFILSKALNVNVGWLMGYDVPMEDDCYRTINSSNIDDLIEKTFGKDVARLIYTYTELDPVGREKFLEAVDAYLRLDMYDRGSMIEKMRILLEQTKYNPISVR